LKEYHEIGTIIQAETFTVELIQEVLLTSLSDDEVTQHGKTPKKHTSF